MIRILVAEDDDVMRAYLERALTRQGYDVMTASNGRDALELLESGTFDLLLSDIVMPEVDGIELAQKAQAMPNPPQVMFITGFAAVALTANSAMPETQLLSKPFHLKDLVAQIEQTLQLNGRLGSA